jgi:hypothetical protein
MQRLTRAGFLIRERSDRWLLTKSAIETLEHPERLGAVVDAETMYGAEQHGPD